MSGSTRVQQQFQRYLARKRQRVRQAARRPDAARRSQRRRSVGRASMRWIWSAGQQREDLPGWKDLADQNNRRALGGSRSRSFLERVSTLRFALVILGLAALGTLYVGHVYATQELLAELQHARNENVRLHLKHNRLKGSFDRVTGPAVIHRRARELGLRESVVYGPTIQVQRSE